MAIIPRPITGKSCVAVVEPLDAHREHTYPPTNQEMPANPKPKLTAEQIAALYKACRYGNVVVPWEPLRRPPMPAEARAV